MKYNLQQGKIKLKNLISSNKVEKALVLCKSLLRNYQDTELLLMLTQIQLLSNDRKGYENTRQLINKKHPTEAVIHKHLASIFKNHGQYQLAIEEYKIALDNSTPDVVLYQELAIIYIHTRYYSSAILLLNSAIQYFPESSRLFLMLGSSHLSLQDIDNAEKHLTKSHELSHDNFDAIVGLANIKYLRKQYDQALDLLEPILDSKFCPFSALLVYSQLASVNQHQQSAISRLSKTPDNSIPPVQQTAKYFALGRLNDELGEYNSAFQNYKTGNTLCQQNYDKQSYDKYFDAIIKSFTPELIDNLKRIKKDSRRLIFIVGMPRSGTSLLEQILASHPEVYGAGELNTLNEIIKQLPARQQVSSSYPHFSNELTEENIETTALHYINHIDSIDKEHQFVTDKMPDNFQYLGLINILFPEAKIIHCSRNAYDICLSCYFQHFTGHYPYAYNLDNLGHYYNHYNQLMSHWKKTLSIPVFDVVYEDLVVNSEEVVRDLLNFCELEYSQQCLSFDKSSRAVTTASAHQASQPLYQKSISRWKNYGSYLEPLFNELKL